MSAKTRKRVTLGRISGVFGVKGWIKVYSYTEPRDNIVRFAEWTLVRDGAESSVEVEDGHGQGRGVVAKLRGIDDADRAREMVGADIVVAREQLPASSPGAYYWTDLEGLEVRTPEGAVLGTVDHLLATGGHDVLVLTGEKERLIPFVLGTVICTVDLDAGIIVADWSVDY